MFVFRFKIFSSNMLEGAMVVAQLVEQSPPRPEIRVQIQSLANLYFEHLLPATKYYVLEPILCNCDEKTWLLAAAIAPDFVYAYHLASPGSNPMHHLCFFKLCCWNCNSYWNEKKTKINGECGFKITTYYLTPPTQLWNKKFLNSNEDIFQITCNNLLVMQR